jgi:hypothetical protein
MVGPQQFAYNAIWYEFRLKPQRNEAPKVNSKDIIQGRELKGQGRPASAGRAERFLDFDAPN